jgi:cytochrome c556
MEERMQLRQEFSRKGLRAVATTARFALLAGLVFGAGGAAIGQDQGAPTPKDTIFARKILMDAIDENMNAVETAVSSGQSIDLDRAEQQADTISAMLMAFPHLFPPSTNQWKPNAERDPARDTYASPEIWNKFSDFYQQASAASKLAYNASRAKQQGDFTKSISSLRTACNACHADYLKTDQ